MLFKVFADYLEKLEEISSRLEIMKVLADLIGEMREIEADKGVYLVLGQLGPNFDNTQFNMAGKMILRSVADGTGLPLIEIEKKYKTKGDLGLLVQELAFKNNAPSRFNIDDVYKRLRLIAEESGEGSQERKVTKLSELLMKTSAIERKFIARIVMGKLRLGFSEKTIFDTLSQIESGGKTLRKELDKAFQIYPDSGYITKTVKSLGMKGLKNIKVKTGVPVVPALCQRLNNYSEIVDKMKDLAVERKYDGTRVQIHFNRSKKEIKTFTRNLDESSPMFPELKEIGDWLKADEVILDGEAVGYDRKTNKVLPFQITITRKRKHGVETTAKEIPLRFYVFDILNLNGESMIEKPYFERRAVLSKIVIKNNTVVPDEYFRTNEPMEVKKMHDKFLKEGYEGAVIKTWSGKYLPGRQGWNWVKIKEIEGTSGKLADTLDLVVLGYNRGRGKRAGFGIGAFLVGLKKDSDWVSIAKVGTGLTDEEFVNLRRNLDKFQTNKRPGNYLVSGALTPDVWVEPSVVVEIAADEITKSPSHAGGIALRFPRLVRFRVDKSPKEASTWEELEQIAKMAKA